MAFGHIPPGLGGSHRVERPLVGLAEIEADLFDGSGDDQQIGRNRLRQHGRGEVFINHGSHPAQIALLVRHHRDAAAARRR